MFFCGDEKGPPAGGPHEEFEGKSLDIVPFMLLVVLEAVELGVDVVLDVLGG
jgi:hypothetical protein